MDLTLKQQLRLQKQAGIITESQYQKKLSEFIQRSGRSYKDYQLIITNKNTKKEITFDIDSKPTTITGNWDVDDVEEIFQDNNIKPDGTVTLTLRDSHGKILKMGNIVGFQDGKDMIINDLPITQDLKEFEKKTTKLLKEEDEKESADELIQAFKQSIQSIKQDAKTINPQDEELKEAALALTFGLIASAPGIIEALGGSVTAIKRWASGNPYAESSWGNTLKKYGHKLGDAYISGIASLLQAAFPDKYRFQNWDDKNSDLYKHAHGIYIAILAACAITGASALADVHNIAALAGEASLLGIKASEIQSLASKIAKAA